MRPSVLALPLVPLALALSPAAQALTIFTATITTGQETVAPTLTLVGGAPRPVSSGQATFTLNDAMTALSFSGSVVNLDVTGTQTADPNDNLVAAHLHAPAAPGANAGVVFGFIGTPFSDIAPNDVVLTPTPGGVGGSFSAKWDLGEGNGTTLAAQLPNLLAGLAYINFHTTQNPAGEIRGQVVPIPEPASWALMALGLAAVGVAARRRR